MISTLLFLLADHWCPCERHKSEEIVTSGGILVCVVQRMSVTPISLRLMGGVRNQDFETKQGGVHLHRQTNMSCQYIRKDVATKGIVSLLCNTLN